MLDICNFEGTTRILCYTARVQCNFQLECSIISYQAALGFGPLGPLGYNIHYSIIYFKLISELACLFFLKASGI